MYEEQMDRGVGTVTVPFRFKLSGETHCPERRSGLLGIRTDAKTPWFRTDPVRPGARREPLARSGPVSRWRGKGNLCHWVPLSRTVRGKPPPRPQNALKEKVLLLLLCMAEELTDTEGT